MKRKVFIIFIAAVSMFVMASCGRERTIQDSSVNSAASVAEKSAPESIKEETGSGVSQVSEKIGNDSDVQSMDENKASESLSEQDTDFSETHESIIREQFTEPDEEPSENESSSKGSVSENSREQSFKRESGLESIIEESSQPSYPSASSVPESSKHDTTSKSEVSKTDTKTESSFLPDEVSEKPYIPVLTSEVSMIELSEVSSQNSHNSQNDEYELPIIPIE